MRYAFGPGGLHVTDYGSDLVAGLPDRAVPGWSSAQYVPLSPETLYPSVAASMVRSMVVRGASSVEVEGDGELATALRAAFLHYGMLFGAPLVGPERDNCLSPAHPYLRYWLQPQAAGRTPWSASDAVGADDVARAKALQRFHNQVKVLGFLIPSPCLASQAGQWEAIRRRELADIARLRAGGQTAREPGSAGFARVRAGSHLSPGARQATGVLAPVPEPLDAAALRARASALMSPVQPGTRAPVTVSEAPQMSLL